MMMRRFLALWLPAILAKARYPAMPPKRCNLQNVPHAPEQGTRVAIALFGLVRSNCTMVRPWLDSLPLATCTLRFQVSCPSPPH